MAFRAGVAARPRALRCTTGSMAIILIPRAPAFTANAVRVRESEECRRKIERHWRRQRGACTRIRRASTQNRATLASSPRRLPDCLDRRGLASRAGVSNRKMRVADGDRVRARGGCSAKCFRGRPRRSAVRVPPQQHRLPRPRTLGHGRREWSEKAIRTGRTGHGRRQHGHCLRCSSHHQCAAARDGDAIRESQRFNSVLSEVARSPSCLDARIGANVLGPKLVRT